MKLEITITNGVVLSIELLRVRETKMSQYVRISDEFESNRLYRFYAAFESLEPLETLNYSDELIRYLNKTKTSELQLKIMDKNYQILKLESYNKILIDGTLDQLRLFFKNHQSAKLVKRDLAFKINPFDQKYENIGSFLMKD